MSPEAGFHLEFGAIASGSPDIVAGGFQKERKKEREKEREKERKSGRWGPGRSWHGVLEGMQDATCGSSRTDRLRSLSDKGRLP
jgi:hypothetical protein